MPSIEDLPTDFIHEHNVAIGDNQGDLSEKQIQNIGYCGRYLYYKGWTCAAVAGLMGNFRVESFLNPDVFENLHDYSITDLAHKGYGFPQFTPWLGTGDYNTPEKQRNYHGTNNPTYIRWCFDNGHTSDYWRADLQLDYIDAGLGASGWPSRIATMRSQTDYTAAAEFFYRYYEKIGTKVPTVRANNAKLAYDYLYPYFTGSPVPPTPGTFPIWLLFKFKGRGLN